MKTFKLCVKVLEFVCLYVVLLGIVLAVGYKTSFFNFLFNNQIDPVFWRESLKNTEASMFQQFAYGVLGATCIGWGILMYIIVKYAFAKQQKWAWYALLFSISSWFIFDQVISLKAGVYFNVLFNVVLFLFVSIPLFVTFREFHKKS